MGPATAVSAAIRRVGYRRRRGHAGISAWGAVATLTVAMHSGRAQIIAIYIVARARTFIPHPRRTAAMRAFMFRPLGTLGERSGSLGPCIPACCTERIDGARRSPQSGSPVWGWHQLAHASGPSWRHRAGSQCLAAQTPDRAAHLCPAPAGVRAGGSACDRDL